MRVVAGLIAAMLLLTGCDPIGPGSRDKDQTDRMTSTQAAALAAGGSGFDYRYAFQLPGARVKPVLQSNADACDRLGPSRCRIVGVRYVVDGANHISAVLTIKIDPVVARPFGEAVSRAVSGADGVLVETEITGAEGTSVARSNALVGRLREQLANAEAQVKNGGPAAAGADTRAARIRAALETIAEVEAGQGQTLATAPMLFTYESSNALTGLAGSPNATFKNAGATLNQSLAQLTNLLAGVGPWLLAMLALVLVLRLIIHGTGASGLPSDSAPNAVPVEPEADRDDRNLIQRWFSRDDDEDDRH